MIPMHQLVNNGFEIKAASTFVINNIVHQSIFLQKGADAFVCGFRQNQQGKFEQYEGMQLG
jgi:hypothetical protein